MNAHFPASSTKAHYVNEISKLSVICYSIVSFMCKVLQIVVCHLSFFFWPLCYQSFELRILITSLVSSNSSYVYLYCHKKHKSTYFAGFPDINIIHSFSGAKVSPANYAGKIRYRTRHQEGMEMSVSCMDFSTLPRFTTASSSS